MAMMEDGQKLKELVQSSKPGEKIVLQLINI